MYCSPSPLPPFAGNGYLPVKPLGQTWKMLQAQCPARYPNAKLGTCWCLLPAHHNIRSFRGMINCVIDQIRDSTPQFILAPEHLQTVIDVKGQMMFFMA